MNNIVGQRICIIGLSSSGKSTLAAKIAEIHSLQLLHLDQIAHLPNTNWMRRNKNEFKRLHHDFIASPRWIIEGNYSCTMAERFARADTIIMVQMNRFGCLYRFIRRSCFEKQTRIGVPKGVPDSLTWRMVKHILFHGPQRIPQYQRLLRNYPHLKTIYLKSFAQIDRFVTSLQNNPCING